MVFSGKSPAAIGSPDSSVHFFSTIRNASVDGISSARFVIFTLVFSVEPISADFPEVAAPVPTT